MKTYIIVTNDSLELPVSGEIVGAEAVAKRLGIKLQRLRQCLCLGFPKKAKYKAVVIADKQFEDMKIRQRYHCKKYDMRRDRTEYDRLRYLERKVGA